jgi:hypothetical protein
VVAENQGINFFSPKFLTSKPFKLKKHLTNIIETPTNQFINSKYQKNSSKTQNLTELDLSSSAIACGHQKNLFWWSEMT